MATAEKALLDTLYLSPAKSGIFKSLPELDTTEINLDKLQKMVKKIPSKRRQQLVLNQLNTLHLHK